MNILDNNEKKLKPVIFRQGECSFHRQNVLQQNLLLKALQVTTDVNKLKEMAGIKTVAEVYRTLDKLAMRKEYHEALVRQGIDLDYLTGGIKKICDDRTTSAGDKLKGFQVLLKSLGLSEYKDIEGSQIGWEDSLMKAIEVEKEKEDSDENYLPERVVYDVKVPETPEEEKRDAEKEKNIGKSIYE